MKNVQVLVSTSPTTLALVLGLKMGEGQKVAVVEAEYGSKEVLGSSDKLSLNHHVRSERPCPCSLSNEMFDGEREELEVIGISHFDLDTLGGICALLGVKPTSPEPGFWEMAEWVDTRGPHRIKECPSYNAESHIRLASFWTWSQANRLVAPKEGGQPAEMWDCTKYVFEAIEELKRILDHTSENEVVRGKEFLAKEEALKAESFVSEGVSASGIKVVLRRGKVFANHLYYTKDGSPAHMVVGYNENFEAVTVSRCGDDVPVVAKEFVQELWGQLAGGHAGIAGSPRGEKLLFSEAERAFDKLLKR